VRKYSTLAGEYFRHPRLRALVRTIATLSTPDEPAILFDAAPAET